MVDEAVAVAEKFLDSTSICMVNRGEKFDRNSVAFHMLCVRQLFLERLRSQLITGNLCAVIYIHYAMRFRWCTAACRFAHRYSFCALIFISL